MKSLQENMLEFRKQLAKGAIQKAYRGLMQYMMSQDSLCQRDS
jgi:hypothetical protein